MITPDEIAQLDQDRAGANAALAGWVTAFRNQMAQHGEAEAAANVALALIMVQPGEALGLLLAALWQMAEAPT
jgi:hypothetical protein